MDRFKFRVWSEFGKKYFRNEDVFLKQDGTGLVKCFYAGDEEKQYLLEQCTGLKDRNHHLLFENDIIKDKFGRIMQIVWRDDPGYTIQGCFAFKAITETNFQFACFDSWWNLIYMCLQVEIIGNIHNDCHLLENPEAL